MQTKRNETFTLTLGREESYLIRVAVEAWIRRYPDDAAAAHRVLKFGPGNLLAIVSDRPFDGRD